MPLGINNKRFKILTAICFITVAGFVGASSVVAQGSVVEPENIVGSNTETIDVSVNDSSNGYDKEQIEIEVVQQYPADLEENDVSQEAYDAVVGNDEQLTVGHLEDAIDKWSNNQDINGYKIDVEELTGLIDVWAN